MDKADALALRLKKIDMNLAETQGAQRALELVLAGLIATHPDPEKLQKWLVLAEEKMPPLSSPPVELGYRDVRTRLAQLLLERLGNSTT